MFVNITLLLDLDDTLLETNTADFLPAYYQALANYLSEKVPPQQLMGALMAGVKRMLANIVASRTLQDVFEEEFYSRLEVPKQELQGLIDKFYSNVFPSLREATRQRPGASELVKWAVEEGNQVAVATDPLFPRQATFERVRWAGLDPQQFGLISTYETFHFTKDHPAYFAEFMGRLGWPDRPALMAGNDIQRDLEPAQVIGLSGFRVEAEEATGATPIEVMKVLTPGPMHGSLAALRSFLQGGQFVDPIQPQTTSRAIQALLQATPAVLHGFALEISAETWTVEPSNEDWALVELVCHLRDTEREVHHAQISALVDDAQPFVPRPDAAVWAKQRRYLNEDGPTAVLEFAAARMETLRRLEALPDDIWSKVARHAIFGPTTFGEVLGFMADHDRMHLQQAVKTLAMLRQQPHRKP